MLSCSWPLQCVDNACSGQLRQVFVRMLNPFHGQGAMKMWRPTDILTQTKRAKSRSDLFAPANPDSCAHSHKSQSEDECLQKLLLRCVPTMLKLLPDVELAIKASQRCFVKQLIITSALLKVSSTTCGV